jgi:hypothetical protein
MFGGATIRDIKVKEFGYFENVVNVGHSGEINVKFWSKGGLS